MAHKCINLAKQGHAVKQEKEENAGNLFQAYKQIFVRLSKEYRESLSLVGTFLLKHVSEVLGDKMNLTVRLG